MPVEKERLERKEKRLLLKIKSPKAYKIIAGIIFLLFGFKKKYLIYKQNKRNKRLGIISLTTDKLFGKKLSYIDDFIVDKKARGKGIGSKLFTKALEKLENEQKSDLVFLLTKKDRKESHNIYKKYGFSLISLGIGFIAYKKIKNKK